MTPAISIVIPAYNVEDYIAPTLRSALAQRDVGAEVIVVDDGSTDATPRVLDGFRADPRLRVIRQANQGLPAARNAGLAAARGRHVGFLDGDDLWDPMKAARHVALLDSRPELDLTYSWWRIIDDAGQVTGRANTEPAARLLGGLSFEGLAIENFAGNGSTVVCRREALLQAGGFDPALRACEDLDAWLRVALLREGNIGLVPELLTSYRMRGGQMTRDWQRMLTGWEMAIGKARQRAPARIASVLPQAIARRNRFLAYIAYEAGDRAAARDFILRAWRSSPRALLGDRRCWLVTGAVAVASVLPDAWHDRLAEVVKTWRARRALLRAADTATAAATGQIP